MRVISGKYRGANLLDFKGEDIRPTADRVKENLFNILRDKIDGSTFLDLFCGTGGMGIEAISRGAGEVIFTDISKKSAELTDKILKKLHLYNKAILIDGVEYLKTTKKKFDVIFIDPPYKSELGRKALEVIAERGLLTGKGVAVFEHEESFSGEIEGLFIVDERKYGRVYLTFFSKIIGDKCVYAGTFDPITVGHVASINKALTMFEKVAIGILVNQFKFPVAEPKIRKEMIEKVFNGDSRIEVEIYNGLLVDFAKKQGTKYFVRGIRDKKDITFEEEMRKLNEKLYPSLKTVYIEAEEEFKDISSTLIKEKLSRKEDISGLVPEAILSDVKKIYGK